MPAIDYTLTRDEMITERSDVTRTQFGWDIIYWLMQDTGGGIYETDAHEPLCALCVLDMWASEIDETHAYQPEFVEGYEPGFLYCEHCGTDVTEL